MTNKFKHWFLFFCFIILFLGISSVSTEVSAKTALSKSQLTLSVGQTKTLKLNGSSGKVTWSSNKKSVASIDSKGKITAKGKGSAIITAKNKGVKYTCKVCVYKVTCSNSQVAAKAKSILKSQIKGNMSDAQKIKAIHDYMILNCAYDYSSYLNGRIPKTSFSAAGVLLKKKAVCQGYAEAFQLFMDSLGISCKTITGTANGGGHAWNMVKVNKQWYHIDVTWDDPVPDEKGQLCYEYFLIKDSVMDDDHKWTKSNYPKCTGSSDTFISLFGTVSKDSTAAAASLAAQYQAGSNTLTLIVSKKVYDSNTSFLWDCVNGAAELLDMECYGISCSHYSYGKYYIYSLKLSFTPKTDTAPENFDF